MRTLEKLAKYRQWLTDFKLHEPGAVNNPLSEWHKERGPERFDLTTPAELAVAKRIREQVLGKTK